MLRARSSLNEDVLLVEVGVGTEPVAGATFGFGGSENRICMYVETPAIMAKIRLFPAISMRFRNLILTIAGTEMKW